MAEPKKILLVDDEKVICVLLKEFFTGLGYEVECAYDGLEAEESFEKFKPDVVLLDIRMPKMNGLEFLDSIRNKTSQCHVIVTTGAQDADLGRRCLEKGAHDFLSKPIKLDEVLDKVEALV